jgi:hypothetical protein
MKHNHHLVPRHLGGTDDKSNIVENISVTRHAMFHYANWLLYKSDGDYIAYRALTGTIGKEELVKELCLMGSKKGGKTAKESGQLREAALKQPKEVRVNIGNKLGEWNKTNKNKNKRNSKNETFELRNIKKIFHIYEKITERTIGNLLGSIEISAGEDLSYVSTIIKEKFNRDTHPSKLANICLGDRLLHNGVSCSLSIEKCS